MYEERRVSVEMRESPLKGVRANWFGNEEELTQTNTQQSFLSLGVSWDECLFYRGKHRVRLRGQTRGSRIANTK